MTRYLGIDYGSKKIGLAVSDEGGKLAFPFSVIQNKNKEKSLQEIIEILENKNIENVVIGESLNFRGGENKIMKEVKDFAERLEKALASQPPKPPKGAFPSFGGVRGGQTKTSTKIHFEKEWLSTLEARRFSDRRNADDSAAAIILQRFLDKVNKK